MPASYMRVVLPVFSDLASLIVIMGCVLGSSSWGCRSCRHHGLLVIMGWLLVSWSSWCHQVARTATMEVPK